VDEYNPWWLWPNLLSLDAPIIAVIWQSFFGLVEGVKVPQAAIAALALAVWGIYLADRWLDGRKGGCYTDRHRFAARYPASLALLICLAFPLAGGFAFFALPNSYLKIGGLLAAFMLVYFAAVHLLARRAGLGRLKEASVGAGFSMGVAIPLIVENSQLEQQWIVGVIAFGGLCTLNCLLISRWEEPPDSAPARWTICAAGALALAAALGARLPVTGAVLFSLAVFLGLIILRRRVSTRGLRVLADGALLSPLIVVLFV
jgi:hypothetical protein